jgi:hypothetical protein
VSVHLAIGEFCRVIGNSAATSSDFPGKEADCHSVVYSHQNFSYLFGYAFSILESIFISHRRNLPSPLISAFAMRYRKVMTCYSFDHSVIVAL